METELLKKLQNIELNILIELDSFCKSNEISYSLIAGTLLGAVRHKGFIPWDDDVDIAMTRSEYTKFCECIKKHPIQGYAFYNFENDANAIISHGKLCKTGTVFLQAGDIEEVGHHEIWIDIFPLDKISNSSKSETARIGKEIVLFTRANGKRFDDGLSKRIVRSIFRLYPRRHQRLLRDVKRLQELDLTILDNYEWVSMSTLSGIKKMRFPKDLLDDYTKVDFENYQFMAFSGYKKILEIMYGDYMKLPEESDRICKHNPIKIIM